METLSIQQKLLKVQTELKAPKNQYNSFGKYKYRSQEDILEAVKPLCAKYELCLIITSETVEICGQPFVNATVKVFTQQDEPIIEVSVQSAVDFSKKGMLLEQTSASATSFARKYALGGMFLIDDTKDADATNTHGNAPTEKSGKPVLPKSGKTFTDAKKFVAGDAAKIATIRNKYQVTSEVEQLLLN